MKFKIDYTLYLVTDRNIMSTKILEQAVDASGVHIGQEDIPVLNARKIIGDNKTLGVSVSTLEQATKELKEMTKYIKD